MSNAELIVRALQHDASAARRVQPNVANGWAEAVLRKSEIFQCSPHEDAGRMHRPVQCRLGIHQEHARPSRREQPSTLKAGETGAHNYYIRISSHGSAGSERT